MSEVVSYQLKENIGVIVVNSPPVNALSQSVREGILDAVNQAQEDSSEAIVLRCDGRTFIAGADITEFGKPPKSPGLPEVLSAIENSSKPVIAAIHGTALGGDLKFLWPVTIAARLLQPKWVCRRSNWAFFRVLAERSEYRGLRVSRQPWI